MHIWTIPTVLATSIIITVYAALYNIIIIIAASPVITLGDKHLFKSHDDQCSIRPAPDQCPVKPVISMSSMMSQVVQKTTPLKERRGSISRTHSLHVTSSNTSLTSSSPSNIIRIRKLVSSPSFSAERSYPEILYRPSSTASLENATLSETDSENAITPDESSATNVDGNSRSPEVNVRERGLKRQQTEEELVVVGENQEIIKVRAVLVKHVTRQHPVIIQRIQSEDRRREQEKPKLKENEKEETDGEIQTSETSDKVPTKVSNSCGIAIPSEMDLFDSMQPIIQQLDSNKRTFSESSSTTSNDIGRPPSSLVSPERRRSLVEEASRHVQRKRYSSELNDSSYELPESFVRTANKSTSTSELMSPARREKLIEDASEYIIQRRKSHDVHTPMSPTLTSAVGYSQSDESSLSNGTSFQYLLQTSPTHSSNS